jgi:hypothetical protein
MSEVDQDLDALFQNVVGALPFDTGDKANPASIVFVGWMVEALRFRQTISSTVIPRSLTAALIIHQTQIPKRNFYV